MEGVFNVNVGLLGHVDSGKTALARALSEVLSVAALDKHPQSQERGITIDIGLSAFKVPCPERLKQKLNADTIQFSLIDCPGHASLIKTVLVGAQIMDIAILVVDATKGIQAQTGECIVLGELLSESMVVALNKIDLFPEEQRMKHVRRAGRSIMSEFKLTRFADCDIVPLSAAPQTQSGLEDLKKALLRNLPHTKRAINEPFLFMADHCFHVKGHGSVLSGTVLNGRMTTGGTVELPAIKQQFKVKSMQCFKEAQDVIAAGDRAAMCLSALDSKKIERTIVCAPGTISTVPACICIVGRCRFYSSSMRSRQRVCVTLGHQTRMAKAVFFGQADGAGCSQAELLAASFTIVGKAATARCKQSAFALSEEYCYQDELYGVAGRPADGGPFAAAGGMHYGYEWALLLFDKPVLAQQGSILICTRQELQQEASDASCRIAFCGNIAHIFEQSSNHNSLKIYRNKFREGVVDRVEGNGVVVVRNMFKKETDIDLFLNKPVVSEDGACGSVEARFGKSGKVKVTFNTAVATGTRVALCIRKYVRGLQ